MIFAPEHVVTARGELRTGPVALDRGGARFELNDEERAAAERLEGKWLVPAIVNAHSHAFQRALRGRVETKSAERPDDDFWSWRTEMYRLALSMDLDEIERTATWAYRDMVRAGYGVVGEFHYVHKDKDGALYDDVAAIPKRLARAAQVAGIRLVLLTTAYERAGPGRPALEDQRRFVFADVEGFLAFHDAVVSAVPEVRHGLAIHSVRACSRPWIEAVAGRAREREIPLHIHACEQRQEIVTCREEHGVAPVELLEVSGALGPRTTLVHATHLEAADPARLAQSGTMVCLCPSTERNLGDGLCPIFDLHRAGVALCIGSDQHARIDPFDELRSIEEHERIRLERRNVLTSPGQELARALMPIGTINGARSLGIDDASRAFVVVDAPPEGLVDALMIAGSARDVVGMIRDGRRAT